MSEILRRLANLEKDYNTMLATWGVVKWISGFLFVYLLGTGIYVWRWTRWFKKYAKYKINERADELIVQFGKENERIAVKIDTLDECDKERGQSIGILFEKVKHETEQRRQQISDCKDRCDAVRCKD